MKAKSKKIMVGVTAASATALSVGAVVRFIKGYKAKKTLDTYLLNHANCLAPEQKEQEASRHYIKMRKK